MPDQNVVVRRVDLSDLGTLEVEPAPELLRGELIQAAAEIDQWFQTLGRSELPIKGLGEIVHLDRKDSGLVRAAIFTDPATGAELDAEVLHFHSSPEIWLTRLAPAPGEPVIYALDSWFGMHDPSHYEFNSAGEVLGFTGFTGEVAEGLRQILWDVANCREYLQDLAIEKMITGEPRFAADDLPRFLAENRGSMPAEVSRVIAALPRQVIKADLAHEETVSLWGIAPYDRKDLRFYDEAGTLQIEAVRAAVPSLMRAYDILRQHGFQPCVAEERLSDSLDEIPMLRLEVQTAEARARVTM